MSKSENAETVLSVIYNPISMELTVRLSSSGELLLSNVRLDEYKAFRESGLSYETFVQNLKPFHACYKA